MQKVELNWEEMRDAEEAHVYLGQKFEFPDYYGGNLDALYDCLTEICEDTLIEIHNSEACQEYGKKLYQVFLDAEEENPFLRFLF